MLKYNYLALFNHEAAVMYVEFGLNRDSHA